MKNICTILFMALLLVSCKKEKNNQDENNIVNDVINNNNNSNSKIETSFQPGSSGFYYNSPIIRDNYIYIGTSRKLFDEVATDNFFYKLDLDLNKIWQYSLGTTEVRGSAVLDQNGNVYFTAQEGKVGMDVSNMVLYVYSLDNQGQFRWKKLIASGNEIQNVGAYELAVKTNLYVQGNAFYALNLADGSEAWKVTMTNGVSKPILDASENIYLVNFGSFVSYTMSGQTRWTYTPNDSFTENGDAYSNPAFATNDQSSIIFLYDTWMYNINANNGTVNWKFNAPFQGTQRTTPIIDADGNIYIGRKNHNIASTYYCVKADGSGILWSKEGFGDVANTGALANDDLVYFGSEMLNIQNAPVFYRMHALNRNTGEIIWEEDLTSDVAACSVAVGPNGKLYVGTIGYPGVPSKLFKIKSNNATGELDGAINAQFDNP